MAIKYNAVRKPGSTFLFSVMLVIISKWHERKDDP